MLSVTSRRLHNVAVAVTRTPLFVTSQQVFQPESAMKWREAPAIEEQMALKMALKDQELDALRAKLASLEIKLSPPRCAQHAEHELRHSAKHSLAPHITLHTPLLIYRPKARWASTERPGPRPRVVKVFIRHSARQGRRARGGGVLSL